MPEIVRQREGLGEVLVEAERARKRAGDLGGLKGMGKAGAEMVALMEDEHLRLVGEPAKGRGVNDAVAIAAEGVAGAACPLAVEPAAARRGIGGIRRAWNRGSNRHARPSN